MKPTPRWLRVKLIWFYVGMAVLALVMSFFTMWLKYSKHIHGTSPFIFLYLAVAVLSAGIAIYIHFIKEE